MASVMKVVVPMVVMVIKRVMAISTVVMAAMPKIVAFRGIVTGRHIAVAVMAGAMTDASPTQCQETTTHSVAGTHGRH